MPTWLVVLLAVLALAAGVGMYRQRRAQAQLRAARERARGPQPPSHPNCRCTLTLVRPQGVDAALDEFEDAMKREKKPYMRGVRILREGDIKVRR
jgi:hypothetical protein